MNTPLAEQRALRSIATDKRQVAGELDELRHEIENADLEYALALAAEKVAWPAADRGGVEATGRWTAAMDRVEAAHDHLDRLYASVRKLETRLAKLQGHRELLRRVDTFERLDALHEVTRARRAAR